MISLRSLNFLSGIRYDTDYETVEEIDYYMEKHGNLPVLPLEGYITILIAAILSLLILHLIRDSKHKVIFKVAHFLFSAILLLIILATPPLLFSLFI